MDALKRFTAYLKRHWLTTAFILGFVVDNITLNRVDEVFDNIVLFSYVVLAMLSIILLYAGIAERFGEKMNLFLKTKAPLLMQYAFGGLLSGMLIFYGRSGSFVDSWPFIVGILAVIYGNETIKDRSGRLVYNLVIFFVGLLAYLVLVIPVLLGKMGPFIFVLSGALSLLVMYSLMRTLGKIIPNFMELQKRNVVFIIGLIFVGFNFLYFSNIIPPIPLSLKDVGVYHDVVRYEDGRFGLTYEEPSWWEWYRDSDKTFHFNPGDNIFCYASVFAPSRLAVDVYHRWEYYDERSEEWVEKGRYAYPIQGGRGDGYRGYTQISNYSEGKWRCTVETARGQVIGKEVFVIKEGGRKPLIDRVE